MTQSSSHEALERVVADTLSSIGSINTAFPIIERERSLFHASLADKPDNYVVEGAFEGYDLDPGQGSVEVDSADELEFAISSLFSQSGRVISKSGIRLSVEHEEQHALAYRKQGVITVRYGFTLTQALPVPIYRPYVRGMWGSEFGITKLHIAAVTAAPIRPSKGDMADLRMMGYKGLADVGMRLYEANSNAGSNMFPLPSSFSITYSPSGEEQPYISIHE